jgi:formylglycine-generating enzyme required for sulfatase activity
MVYKHKKTGLEFSLIPGGTFIMGSPDGEEDRYSDEGPQHEVKLLPFLMSSTEVTQGVWKKIMSEEPSCSSYGIGSNYPVNYISWDDCKAFCKKTGLQLPSESMWEYACRAGTGTRFSFGDDIGYKLLPKYEWVKYNSGDKTHVVATKPSNGFGLYDMSGNVWEWCEDKYHGNYNGAPIDGSAWISGSSLDRVIRSGGFDIDNRWCRSADRDWYSPSSRDCYWGTRFALLLQFTH